MESVQAREHIEFPVKDSSVANVTALRWVDRDVLIALVSLLVAQLLSVVGVLLDLGSQR